MIKQATHHDIHNRMIKLVTHHDIHNRTKADSRWQRDRIDSEELFEPRTGVPSSNKSLENILMEYQSRL